MSKLNDLVEEDDTRTEDFITLRGSMLEEDVETLQKHGFYQHTPPTKQLKDQNNKSFDLLSSNKNINDNTGKEPIKQSSFKEKKGKKEKETNKKGKNNNNNNIIKNNNGESLMNEEERFDEFGFKVKGVDGETSSSNQQNFIYLSKKDVNNKNNKNNTKNIYENSEELNKNKNKNNDDDFEDIINVELNNNNNNSNNNEGDSKIKAE